MKLSILYEEERKNIYAFYKGMSLDDFEKFKRHRIPGFLGDLDLALIYADPRTMQSGGKVIISVPVDITKIEDKRDVIDDMTYWYHASSIRDKLKSSIWWSTSGGHGNRGIYYGKPVKHYDVVFYAKDEEEYYDYVDKLGLKKKADELSSGKDEESTWMDYLGISSD